MKLVFKGAEVLNKSGAGNAHQLGLRLRISATTAYKYFSKPDEVQAFDVAILAAIITDGLGLSPEEAMNLKLGDIFEIKD